MSLNNFVNLDSGYKEKMSRLERLKKRFSESLPENIAKYKAQEIVLTSDKLESVKLNANNHAGLRPSLAFYFENAEEIKMVAKYFNTSFKQMAVKDSGLLIEIIKMLEETKNG